MVDMANCSISLKEVIINFWLGITLYFNFFLLCFLPQSGNSQMVHFKHTHIAKVAYDQDIYHYTHSVRWSCFNYSNSSDKPFDCCKIKYIFCTESGPSLMYGYCATYVRNELHVGPCLAYYQSNSFNSTFLNHIALPVNINELNYSICGPLKRKGLLCSECVDGYGISVTSFGYKCTNCTGVWYAVPLFLLLEFVPVTMFYLIVLTFQISVTSPPMPCFIMYAQIIVYLIDHRGFNVFFPSNSVTKDGELILSMKFIRIIYGLFYLDGFRYISPPLCLSSLLQPIHVVLLGYITVFYPLFLIFLTWVCVKLHDHNVRLIVWLWRPFHKCFVRLRKRWDTKTDLIDVFITFFILSYYKLVYLASAFLNKKIMIKIDQSGSQSTTSILGDLDPDMPYLSKTYIGLAAFSILVLLIFNILPPLMLILFPTRALFFVIVY